MTTAVRAKDIKYNFKEICTRIISGETLIVPRPKNENIVLISEKEYQKLEKIKKNAEYLASLDRGNKDIAEGRKIYKTMDELEELINS